MRIASPPPRPGHVFWFPAGATWLNQDKPRPFALVAGSGEDVPGTLVYGSTQRTEQVAGASSIEVIPIRQGLNRNGLVAITFFYPGILFMLGAGALPAPAGFLGRSLPALRTALRAALGIGRGSCLDAASPVGSRRGRIVELRPATARRLRSPFAIILTEPAYSSERQYQLIVPIVPGFPRSLDQCDVPVSGADWLGIFNRAVEGVVVPAAVTLSIWHSQSIARETEYVVDDGTLAEIDRRLCDYFSLTPVDEGR